MAIDDSGRPLRVVPPPAPTPQVAQTTVTSPSPSISSARETRRKQRRERNSKEQGPAEWIKSKVQEYLAPTPVGETPKILELVKSITWTGVAILVVLELFAAVRMGSLPFDAQRAVPPPDLRSISPTE